MATITDDEFGTIILRRSARASSVRLRITPAGHLHASLPMYAPTLLVKRLIKSSRTQIRTMLHDHHSQIIYTDGMQIGKSHSLVIQTTELKRTSIITSGQRIIVRLARNDDLSDKTVQRSIRDAVIKSLRKEAKHYLPKRLNYLATKHDFIFKTIRFSHASGRWGSCNSNGTISLNIALMKLPFELIDYVLIHELSHTRHMNHALAFWEQVEKIDPMYTIHRKMLKNETPSI